MNWCRGHICVHPYVHLFISRRRGILCPFAGHHRGLLTGAAAFAARSEPMDKDGECNSAVADLMPLRGHAPMAKPARYDPNRGLVDLFGEAAAINGDRTAVLDNGRQVTYAELDAISSALAGKLAVAGVKKGDVVALLAPRSLDAIAAILAILKAGGVYAPMDPAYPLEHIAYMMRESAPKAVFHQPGKANALLRAVPPQALLLDLAQAVEEARAVPASQVAPVEAGNGDAAYVMYTSGSTGRPKGVVVPHRAISRVVIEQNYIRFSPDDVVLHAATMSFDASTLEIWGALLNGATLAIAQEENFSLSALCDVIGRHSVTIAWMTTGLFNLFCDHAKDALPSLRHVLFGGEVGSAEHVRRFLKAYPGVRLTNGYGPTETTVFATAYPVPADFGGADLPIGRAIAHTRLHILDGNLAEAPAGVEGQLAVSGQGLAIGYLNRPDLTDETFVEIETHEGPVRCYLTGDIASIGADGLVSFRGRRDRQIKIDGKRIELDEIEAALRRDPEVGDAIVSCHDTEAGKRIVAYLKPRKAAYAGDELLARRVIANLRNVLPVYMIPAATMIVEAYPMNRAGKVDRSKLPLPAFAAAAATAPVKTASGNEALVRHLWGDVFGNGAIGRDSNFFDLGGTSLQLMRVHAGLEAALNHAIDVTVLFSHPTIGSLTSHLDGGTAAAATANDAARRAAMSRRAVAGFRRNAS